MSITFESIIMSDSAGNSKSHFYFSIAVVTILVIGGFVVLETINTTTEMLLVESSFYSVVRNGEARLSAEINRSIQDVDLNILEGGFNEIDEDINNL